MSEYLTAWIFFHLPRPQSDTTIFTTMYRISALCVSTIRHCVSTQVWCSMFVVSMPYKTALAVLSASLHKAYIDLWCFWLHVMSALHTKSWWISCSCDPSTINELIAYNLTWSTLLQLYAAALKNYTCMIRLLWTDLNKIYTFSSNVWMLLLFMQAAVSCASIAQVQIMSESSSKIPCAAAAVEGQQVHRRQAAAAPSRRN